MRKFLLFVFFAILCISTNAQIINAFAGTGVNGFSGNGGAATAATFRFPTYLACDNNNNIYILDRDNNVIRKVNRSTGIISAFAGTPSINGFSGDGGPATSAKIGDMLYGGGMEFDNSNNLYIADDANNCIRKINTSTNIITTVVGNGNLPPDTTGDGGTALLAKLNTPTDICFDKYGNMYIADRGNDKIRKVNALGIITTIAGTGIASDAVTFPTDGTSALINNITPQSISCDTLGNVYFTDVYSNGIFKIEVATGKIYTVFGGSGTTYMNLADLYIDKGNNIFCVPLQYNKIYKLSTTGLPLLIAGKTSATPGTGNGGLASNAGLHKVWGITGDKLGNLFLSDALDYTVRQINNTTTLPLKFTSFTATNNCNTTTFNWQTANEVNNKQFVVQQSINGVDFTSIATVEPSTTNSYKYTTLVTTNDIQQSIIYYRIKQIDNDGKFSYSETQKVNINCISKQISIYPNPTQSAIKFIGLISPKNNITILNSVGNISLQLLNTSENSINVSKLPSGFYIISINNNTFLKFIKQ